MAKRTDIIKERLLDEILSVSEIETVMNELGYTLIGTENHEIKKNGQIIMEKTVKFSHPKYKADVWIKGEADEENAVLVYKVCSVTSSKRKGDPTKVKPFRSVMDFKNVVDYFWNNQQYEYWLCAFLSASLGRRIGDTLSYKWSDFYYKEGGQRESLDDGKFVEQKTEKMVGTIITKLTYKKIEEYCRVCNINPINHYSEKIFSNGYESFRTALKVAVKANGIDYPIGTHSFRKFFGNTLYKLHPQLPNRIKMIQFLFGHSSEQITYTYIDEIYETQKRMMDNYSNFMMAALDGEDMEINYSPVVSIYSNVMREIIGKCWELAHEGVEKFEVMNEILQEIEQKQVMI